MLLRKVYMIPSRHLSLTNIHILKHPGANVALVHDDHWSAVIGEVRRVSEFFLEPSTHLLIERGQNDNRSRTVATRSSNF